MSMEVYSKERVEGAQLRLILASILIITAALLLLMRLWYLQIISGDEYRLKSESNRMRLRPVQAVRGMVLDRYGKVIVDNRPAFDVYLLREDMKELRSGIESISGLLSLDVRTVESSVRKEPTFKPVRIKRDIDRDVMAALLTNKLDTPGIFIEVEPRRSYPYRELASHLLGHIGEITEKQLGDPAYSAYRMGTLVGKTGIELRYEADLRGRDGGRHIEVDAAGREISVLKEINPFPGHNLVTTLDLDLQRSVEELFTDKEGAAIVMDPRNGEILSMVSKPSFNPDIFAGVLDPVEWSRLINDPLKPLQNRAIQGQYPPGSTYKLFLAAAALEEKVIRKDEEMSCGGSYRFGNRVYRCWNAGGHGRVNLHKAIRESCDVYFYQVGLRLGIDRIASYAKRFGLGEVSGIELPEEKSGLVPTKEWRKRRFGSDWIEGETLSCAIGQGFNLATPLQMVTAYSAMGNGGTVYRPHLVKYVTDPNGDVFRVVEPEARKLTGVSKETLELLKDGLSAVVNEAGGTGGGSRQIDFTVAGKTGTSQVIRMQDDKRVKGEDLPYQYRDHAWFVSFAPVESPRVAVVVFIEHSGASGGHAAAPLAGKIYKRYLELEKERGMSGVKAVGERP